MPKEIKKTTKKKIKKVSSKPKFYYAVGRRKESSARVRFYPAPSGEVKIGDIVLKKTDILVNGKPIEKYFPGPVNRKYYIEPFRTTNTIGRFAVSIKVSGGGITGQLDAVIHGVARALEKVNKDRFRPILKKKGFLTRDARVKERRKAGLAHKARAKKQSPKR